MSNDKTELEQLTDRIHSLQGALHGLTRNGTRGLGSERIELSGTIKDLKAEREALRAEEGPKEETVWTQCETCGCFYMCKCIK